MMTWVYSGDLTLVTSNISVPTYKGNVSQLTRYSINCICYWNTYMSFTFIWQAAI